MYVRLVRLADGLSRDTLYECYQLDVVEISRRVNSTPTPQSKGEEGEYANGKLFMLDDAKTAAFEVMQGEPAQVYIMNRDGKTIERYTGA